jgi:hypothetical protein
MLAISRSGAGLRLSFFSRVGHHHHIAGAHPLPCAQEASWREDNRTVSNGDQVKRLAGLALSKRKAPIFTGYWQRNRNQIAS